jgi:hypothetical protein
MDKSYKYYAFISYKSDDEKWAKRLQDQIEKFRLPAYLCKKNPANPKRLKPCFRYHTDIGINELKTELQEKLERSKFLIVVCSPRSAKSEWVGEEIETFVRLGRKNNIIPFVVDGKPYSGDADECYHPVIRKNFPRSDSRETDQEILGANVHEEGQGSARTKWNKAVVKVIAKMQGLEFDELWQREQRRRVRRTLLWTTVCLATLCLTGFAYYVSQPCNVQVELKETSVHNDNLPPLKDAVVTMVLENETKVDTLHEMGEILVFKNIPHKFMNKSVKITVFCRAFLPVDSTVKLSKVVTVNMVRDPDEYGDIRFHIYDPMTETYLSGVEVTMEGQTVWSNDSGLVTMTIPLAMQREKYPFSATIPLNDDTIYPPCKGAYIVIKK